MQHAAAAFPAAQVADHFMQEQVRQALPFGPVFDLVELFGPTHAPVQVHRVLEALGAAMLDQAVHLSHARPGGDQYQGTIRQLGQVRIAKRHLDACQTLALQLRDQLPGTGLAHQHVQLQFTTAVGRRGQGKGRRLAAFALDHQVLPGVVAQWLASRRTQAHAPDVATDLDALAHAARQLAHWQLAQGEHTVPEQHTVLQRFGNAGEQLAMITDFAVLTHASFHQQCGADMTIAIAAAVRAFIAQPPRSIQDPFTGFERQHRPGRLQRYLHQSIPN
ncbi:hypothetical protein D3C81_947680 [compost metagenome]